MEISEFFNFIKGCKQKFMAMIFYLRIVYKNDIIKNTIIIVNQ